MQILTRNISESIRLSDDITITILSIRDNHVWVGIDVPDKTAASVKPFPEGEKRVRLRRSTDK